MEKSTKLFSEREKMFSEVIYLSDGIKDFLNKWGKKGMEESTHNLNPLYTLGLGREVRRVSL